jgi:hypothetical protein
MVNCSMHQFSSRASRALVGQHTWPLPGAEVDGHGAEVPHARTGRVKHRFPRHHVTDPVNLLKR